GDSLGVAGDRLLAPRLKQPLFAQLLDELTKRQFECALADGSNGIDHQGKLAAHVPELDAAGDDHPLPFRWPASEPGRGRSPHLGVEAALRVFQRKVAVPAGGRLPLAALPAYVQAPTEAIAKRPVDLLSKLRDRQRPLFSIPPLNPRRSGGALHLRMNIPKARRH